MNHDHYPDDYIRTILQETKSIAVVGASANPARPSYRIAQYMLSKGYDIFPVNPGQAGKEIAGSPCHASLKDIAQPIHMINIFRNSQAAFAIVEAVLALDPLPKTIWMQHDIRNDEAARLAEENGMKVVMNRCLKIEHARFSNG